MKTQLGNNSGEIVILHAYSRLKGVEYNREFQITRDVPQRLGREPLSISEDDRGAHLVLPEDPKISNNHATVTWDGSQLSVKRRAAVRNQILVLNPNDPSQVRPEDDFRLGFGERFVIGDTFFTLKKYHGPIEELTYGAQELQSLIFQDPIQKIDALAALPEMIRLSPDENQLVDKLLLVLLDGVPRAECAALVQCDPDRNIKVLATRHRSREVAAFEPSRQLVTRALQEFDNVCHVWAGSESDERNTPTRSDMDWAICVRMMDANIQGLYLAGRSPIGVNRSGEVIHATQLDGDMKFAHLAGNIFSALRGWRKLQQKESFLAKLLTPVVRHAAQSGQNIEQFTTPKECPVTVLFCDLRGSVSLAADTKSSLMQTWAKFEDLLDVMTDEICTMDGVIGDFQGDAAMGFWGWPQPQVDQIERAARAALNIRKKFVEFATKIGHPSAGIACGIGIAHGPAVTGRLGTRDQAKIGVFGPVVNRAARLESATKTLRVPILIDDAVYKHLAGLQQREWGRVRRLAKVVPEGFVDPVVIGELLPPDREPGPNLTEENRQLYEVALDQFLAGDWAKYKRLMRVFPPNDGPVDFVNRFIADQASGSPPPGWNGGIPVAK